VCVGTGVNSDKSTVKISNNKVRISNKFLLQIIDFKYDFFHVKGLLIAVEGFFQFFLRFDSDDC
jgi:hypothetical protein